MCASHENSLEIYFNIVQGYTILPAVRLSQMHSFPKEMINWVYSWFEKQVLGRLSISMDLHSKTSFISKYGFPAIVQERHKGEGILGMK